MGGMVDVVGDGTFHIFLCGEVRALRRSVLVVYAFVVPTTVTTRRIATASSLCVVDVVERIDILMGVVVVVRCCIYTLCKLMSHSEPQKIMRF
jgi:hypothetical protein